VRALDEIELVTRDARHPRGAPPRQRGGALIVTAGEAAQQVGFRDGDLILQLNRTAVRTAAEAASVLRRLEGTRTTVRALVERQGQLITLSFNVR
jgi:C-terminal processing protease CtpA/Prc